MELEDAVIVQGRANLRDNSIYVKMQEEEAGPWNRFSQDTESVLTLDFSDP